MDINSYNNIIKPLKLNSSTNDIETFVIGTDQTPDQPTIDSLQQQINDLKKAFSAMLNCMQQQQVFNSMYDPLLSPYLNQL